MGAPRRAQLAAAMTEAWDVSGDESPVPETGDAPDAFEYSERNRDGRNAGQSLI
jgi:hypothetical protein